MLMIIKPLKNLETATLIHTHSCQILDMGTEKVCYILYVYSESVVEPHLSYVITG